MIVPFVTWTACDSCRGKGIFVSLGAGELSTGGAWRTQLRWDSEGQWLRCFLGEGRGHQGTCGQYPWVPRVEYTVLIAFSGSISCLCDCQNDVKVYRKFRAFGIWGCRNLGPSRHLSWADFFFLPMWKGKKNHFQFQQLFESLFKSCSTHDKRYCP